MDCVVTVIIPIYNTPIKDFKRCIDSVMQQSYSNLEIFVIDDGSKHELSEQYIEICQKDERIIYFKHDNKGVSYSRNYGIKKASGNYIVFADADDVLSCAFIEKAVSDAKKYNADLVIGKIGFIPKISTRQNISSHIVERNMDNALKCLFALEDEKKEYCFLGSVCGRIFRAEIAKILFFDENIKYWEDQIYNRMFIEKSSIIILYPETWYYYYQNNYSAIHNCFSNWREMDRWNVFFDKWIEMNKSIKDIKMKKMLDKYLMIFLFQALREGIIKKEKYRQKEILYLINNKAFLYLINNVNIDDFNSTARKFQYVLIKYKLTFLIYHLTKIKMVFRF